MLTLTKTPVIRDISLFLIIKFEDNKSEEDVLSKLADRL